MTGCWICLNSTPFRQFFRTFNVQTIEYIDKIYQQKSRINFNDNRDIYRIKRKVIKNSWDIKFLILI